MLGLFNRLNMDVKTEVQGKENFKTKLKEILKREESSDAARKSVELKNKKLERRVDELNESR